MAQETSTTTDPREPLHPQVKALFDLFAAMRPAERVFDPVQMRAQEPEMIPFLTQGAPVVAREEEIKIPGPAGDIRALLFAPENTTGAALPVLVYLHGGGWVILSPESHSKLTKQLAVRTGAIVFSVDYRLAPENPYPAGLDDCVAALNWVRENAVARWRSKKNRDRRRFSRRKPRGCNYPPAARRRSSAAPLGANDLSLH